MCYAVILTVHKNTKILSLSICVYLTFVRKRSKCPLHGIMAKSAEMKLSNYWLQMGKMELFWFVKARV